MLAAILCLSSFFTINKIIEAVPAALLFILFWLILDRRKPNFRSARVFIYLTPGLILINSIYAVGNGRLELSLNGALAGLILSVRLFWSFFLISVMFRSAPLDEMITLFRTIFRFLHLPEQKCSEIVAITLTLLPDFTSLQVKGLPTLHDAIATRIIAAENKIKTNQDLGQVRDAKFCISTTSTCSFRPVDFALLLPAALFLILTIII